MNCANKDIRQYFVNRNELTIQNGVLLWGLLVVVLLPLQSEVLARLHESHPGCTRCEQLARSYVWWPGIDADIERVVQSCQSCAEQRREANTPVLGRWKYPSTAFHRVHIDHTGPFLGHHCLVWVDAYFKFAGIHRVSWPDAARTVKKLRKVLPTSGCQTKSFLIMNRRSSQMNLNNLCEPTAYSTFVWRRIFVKPTARLNVSCKSLNEQ